MYSSRSRWSRSVQPAWVSYYYSNNSDTLYFFFFPIPYTVMLALFSRSRYLHVKIGLYEVVDFADQKTGYFIAVLVLD